MLYEILLIILGIYVILTPFLLICAVKFGVRLGTKPETAAEEPVFTIQTPHKKPKITKEMQKTMDILENINAYDGSERGQKEII